MMDVCGREGVIEQIIPGNNASTHCGNLYIVRFTDDEDGDDFTQNFDSYDLGKRLKIKK
tara:strand:+ start:196 stop:372 length:177 start_codon:yes stop_codon:yes gene_type:complete